MSFFRTVSTKRLLTLLAAVLAVAAAGTAIAVAADSGGPVPPEKPLANAVHDAIGAPPIDGIKGDVTFTNHLLDGVDVRGSNPLLSGGTGRFWATATVTSASSCSPAAAVRPTLSSSPTARRWWAYDGISNTVYRGTVPQHRAGADAKQPTAARTSRPPSRGSSRARQAHEARERVGPPRPATSAASPSYTVRVAPNAGRAARGGRACLGRRARRAAARRALREGPRPARSTPRRCSS